MVSDLIWGTSCFSKPKTEEAFISDVELDASMPEVWNIQCDCIARQRLCDYAIHQKRPVVPLSNTSTNPRAMMIMNRNTAITNAAMVDSWSLYDFTCWTLLAIHFFFVGLFVAAHGCSGHSSALGVCHSAHAYLTVWNVILVIAYSSMLVPWWCLLSIQLRPTWIADRPKAWRGPDLVLSLIVLMWIWGWRLVVLESYIAVGHLLRLQLRVAWFGTDMLTTLSIWITCILRANHNLSLILSIRLQEYLTSFCWWWLHYLYLPNMLSWCLLVITILIVIK